VISNLKSKRRNSKLPLSGQRMLVGRAKNQARELSAQLRGRGATVLEIPFIEIRPPQSFKPLDQALQRHHSYDWLILTSVNGVATLFDRLAKLRIEREELSHLNVAAIGPATRAAIERQGLLVQLTPRKYIAEAVVARLRDKVEGKQVLLVRAKVARDLIPSELRKAGAQVDVIEAYETVLPSASRTRLLSALKSEKRRPHIITFSSSSMATNFLELAGEKVAYSGVLDEIALASIGPVTSATLRKLNLPVAIEAKEYTIPGLVNAIVEYATVR
jgi:uroporphyrinogen-III synthase